MGFFQDIQVTLEAGKGGAFDGSLGGPQEELFLFRRQGGMIDENSGKAQGFGFIGADLVIDGLPERSLLVKGFPEGLDRGIHAGMMLVMQRHLFFTSGGFEDPGRFDETQFLHGSFHGAVVEGIATVIPDVSQGGGVAVTVFPARAGAEGEVADLPEAVRIILLKGPQFHEVSQGFIPFLLNGDGIEKTEIIHLLIGGINLAVLSTLDLRPNPGKGIMDFTTLKMTLI